MQIQHEMYVSGNSQVKCCGNLTIAIEDPSSLQTLQLQLYNKLTKHNLFQIDKTEKIGRFRKEKQIEIQPDTEEFK